MSYETVPLRKNTYSIEKDRTETWDWDKIRRCEAGIKKKLQSLKGRLEERKRKDAYKERKN
jgi:hypothetical protein